MSQTVLCRIGCGIEINCQLQAVACRPVRRRDVSDVSSEIREVASKVLPNLFWEDYASFFVPVITSYLNRLRRSHPQP